MAQEHFGSAEDSQTRSAALKARFYLWLYINWGSASIGSQTEPTRFSHLTGFGTFSGRTFGRLPPSVVPSSEVGRAQIGSELRMLPWHHEEDRPKRDDDVPEPKDSSKGHKNVGIDGLHVVRRQAELRQRGRGHEGGEVDVRVQDVPVQERKISKVRQLARDHDGVRDGGKEERDKVRQAIARVVHGIDSDGQKRRYVDHAQDADDSPEVWCRSAADAERHHVLHQVHLGGRQLRHDRAVEPALPLGQHGMLLVDGDPFCGELHLRDLLSLIVEHHEHLQELHLHRLREGRLGGEHLSEHVRSRRVRGPPELHRSGLVCLHIHSVSEPQLGRCPLRGPPDRIRKSLVEVQGHGEPRQFRLHEGREALRQRVHASDGVDLHVDLDLPRTVSYLIKLLKGEGLEQGVVQGRGDLLGITRRAVLEDVVLHQMEHAAAVQQRLERLRLAPLAHHGVAEAADVVARRGRPHAFAQIRNLDANEEEALGPAQEHAFEVLPAGGTKLPLFLLGVHDANDLGRDSCKQKIATAVSNRRRARKFSW
eukprot:scaffold7455_cov296-Pinguiococcus_pyrenoidosus.AAC.1